MSKYKSKGDDAPEVFSARSKLDGVLQTLVDQKDEGILGPDKDLFGKQDTDQEFIDNSPQSSPSKKSPRLGKVHRKRKLERDDKSQSETGLIQHMYIMKLFDRSINLAQFSEDTPLYPICRAWIKNQPNNIGLNSQNNSQAPEPEERDAGCVYQLPKPTEVVVKTENGQILDLRIPSPLPQPSETLDSLADQNSGSPAPETLLLNHMVRWKQVRQKWKTAARINEMRYSNSLNILREMYEKQYRDQ